MRYRKISNPRVRLCCGALLLGLTVFGVGKLSIVLFGDNPNASAIWLANAVALAVLLLKPRTEWWLYLAGLAAGTFALDVQGASIPQSLFLPLCSVIETGIAATLLSYFRVRDVVGSWRAVILFLGFGVCTSTAVSLFAAIGIAGALNATPPQAWHTWWMAHAVGMLVLTPVLMALLRPGRKLDLTPRGIIEFTAIAAALVVAAAAGFGDYVGQSPISYGAMLVSVPCMLLLAARFGCGGAGFGNLLLAIMAMSPTVAGEQAIGGTSGLLERSEFVYLGIFVAASMSLLFAALFADRRRDVRRLNDAIGSMSDGFILLDANGYFLLCNEKFRQMFDRTADLLIAGRSFDEIIREGAKRGQYAAARGGIEEWVAETISRRYRAGELFLHQLGDGRWVQFCRRGTQDGGFVGVFTDVTELKQREAELKESQEQLRATIAKLETSDAELRRQATTLQDLAKQEAMQRQEATAASCAKSEFLATMSHEIRSPLNGVMGYTDLLLDSRLTAEQRKHANAVRECGAALVTVINDILDFSKIEAGRFDLVNDQFDLIDVVSGVASISRVTAENKGLRLSVEIGEGVPNTVVGDANRLRQIVLNLVTNAVKFTREGAVDVAVALVSATAERVSIRVSVRDTGIGISPADQAHLFERFYQAGSGNLRQAGGTGLGLAICKKLIELMAGEIGFESTLGVGSQFWFTVELGRGERRLIPAAVTQAPVNATVSVRILLVDDLEINRDLATTFLVQAGHIVETAVDGAEALAAVAANDYDVVLMDIQMPVMDGFEATARIRSMPSPKRDVPIVAMTAYATRLDVERCAKAGMNAHIAKPIAKHSLLDVVNACATYPPMPVPAPPLAAMVELFRPQALDTLERDAGLEKTLQLVAAILDKLERAIERMHDDAVNGAFARIQAEAHKLTSTTGLIGLARVSSLFSVIEENARVAALNDDRDSIAELVDQLREAAQASIPLLQSRVSACSGQEIKLMDAVA